jgi:hypothetical protein
MTFSAVGSIISAVDGTSTFSLTPAAVGDFILFEATDVSTVLATGLSSSNVTWTPLGSSFTGTVNAFTGQVFLGIVTSTATATVTISWSGTPPPWARPASRWTRKATWTQPGRTPGRA